MNPPHQQSFYNIDRRPAGDEDDREAQGVGAVACAELHVRQAVLPAVPQRIRLHHVTQGGGMLAAEKQSKSSNHFVSKKLPDRLTRDRCYDF
jgi:hypothetical protein